MSRDGFERFVERVAKQNHRWGVDCPEESARKTAARVAQRSDHRPKARREVRDVPMPERREVARVEAPDLLTWALKKATGESAPRAAFSQQSGTVGYDPTIAKAKELLERKR